MGNCVASSDSVTEEGSSHTASNSGTCSSSQGSKTTISSSRDSSSISSNTHFSAASGDEAFPNGLIPPTPSLRVFTFAELSAATKNFSSDAVLGEGGFGKVFKGWLEDNNGPGMSASGQVIAVKRLNSESMQGYDEWQAEVRFRGRLSHPNLVKLLGYCFEETELLLVYESVQKGSLEFHLFGTVEPIPWDTRLKIAVGAAKGLSFLHTLENQVIYIDFKTSNILLDRCYKAKLSDFGLAKLGPSASQSHVTTRVMVTYDGYAAPEYVATGHLYVKSHVYGFGVVLIEILTGLRALDHTRPSGRQLLVDWIKPYLSDKRKLKKTMDSRLQGRYPSKSALRIAQLALNCIESDPRNRPSMKEVVEKLEQIEALEPRHRPAARQHGRTSLQHRSPLPPVFDDDELQPENMSGSIYQDIVVPKDQIPQRQHGPTSLQHRSPLPPVSDDDELQPENKSDSIYQDTSVPKIPQRQHGQTSLQHLSPLPPVSNDDEPQPKNKSGSIYQDTVVPKISLDYRFFVETDQIPQRQNKKLPPATMESIALSRSSFLASKDVVRLEEQERSRNKSDHRHHLRSLAVGTQRKQAHHDLHVNAPLSSFPATGFRAEYFVELNFAGCTQYEQAWLGNQRFGSLRVIDFSKSNLKNLPDLSEAHQARSLILRGCKNLANVSCIQHLAKLEHLNLKGCTNLTDLPSVMHLTLLSSIDLSHCINLESLPVSIGCLSSLTSLNLKNCKRLDILPISTSRVKSIQSLNISGCSNLINRASVASQSDQLDFYMHMSVEAMYLADVFGDIGNLVEARFHQTSNLQKREDLRDITCFLEEIKESIPRAVARIRSAQTCRASLEERLARVSASFVEAEGDCFALDDKLTMLSDEESKLDAEIEALVATKEELLGS